jgi:excisionase family DNA binding protein
MTEGRTDSGSFAGNVRASDRQEIYTPAEAAKVLGITDRRVRGLAQEGRIEGERAETGWKLFRWSVHSFRDARRDARAVSEGAQSPAEGREERERVEALQRELGRLEGRLEIEAVARSTLEESITRERERADRLEDELREARKSWWQKLFGG